jgi:cyclophilin family peptidyl-prolyl cis-trans isomerase/predicted DsbA family dithiol-disulfide isomerase
MIKIMRSFILTASVFLLFSCTPVTTTVTANPPAVPLITSTPTAMACTLLHFPATPVALGAEFGDRGHAAGPANAPVTIVVFSDYQCPACAFLDVSLKQIRLTHAADVRVIFVNTPLSDRDKDAFATQAVEAADLQGKFWEMHDLLFEKQAEWSVLTPAAFESWAVQQAAGLGMDPVQFQLDFKGKTVADRLQRSIQSSNSQSISPPILFVNSNSRYSGLADFASLDTVVRMEALSARQFTSCPAWLIDPLKQYVATLHTAKGDVIIQLFPDKAPLAVNNFVSLAQKGWFDGITFYKMLPDFLVMSGDPSETGMGNPGYLFKTEISTSLHFDQPGMVALDNSGPDTNGSRFLITLAPAAQLYGQYTVIGKVISGMKVLSALTPRDPKPGIYLPPGDSLINISIQEH